MDGPGSGCRVLQEIGEGAASRLFAVQDPKSKQVWALKHVVKHDDKDQRFIDDLEARLRTVEGLMVLDVAVDPDRAR